MNNVYSLPFARLSFRAKVENPINLPRYSGSMLRGAFGHALLRLSPLPHDGQTPCALGADCAYCQFFNSPNLNSHQLQQFTQMPHPYVIEPPQEQRRLSPGDLLEFSVVLIGKALNHLQTVILAFENALQNGIGLGPKRGQAVLQQVWQHDNNLAIWDAHERRLLTVPKPVQANAAAIKNSLALRFITPLRLQKQGRPVDGKQLDARRFLMALSRRYQLLCDSHLGSHAPQLDFSHLSKLAQHITLDASQLQWRDWGRFSQRQNREMHLGGLLGLLRLHGDLADFWSLLTAGQWLHVGKNATFGLGSYFIEDDVD